MLILKSCICLCKDTNFKANHNKYQHLPLLYYVVYAYAKILILKQITTSYFLHPINSCCICLCKDTNFKANHNLHRRISYCIIVVYAYAKILILKQITTEGNDTPSEGTLYMPMQRY